MEFFCYLLHEVFKEEFMSAVAQSLGSSRPHPVQQDRPNTKCLSPKAQWVIIAFTAAAGIALVVLGALNYCGPVGSIGFVASIAGGGLLTLAAAGGSVWIVFAKRRVTEATKEATKQAAMDFARQKLGEGNINPFDFKYLGTLKPKNQDMGRLYRLYQHLTLAFEQELKNHREEQWEKPEVIQAADERLQIGYALSRLAYEELIQREGPKVRPTYMEDTLGTCLRAYQEIRGGLMWDSEKDEIEAPTEIPIKHATAFYKEGTTQYKWRMLYNDHLDWIMDVFPKIDLPKSKLDELAKKFVKDERLETFKSQLVTSE
jgi:hypothetical protein